MPEGVHSAILCMRETSESAELRLALLTDGYDVESIEPEMLLSFAQTREGFVIADIDRAATLQAVCRLQESATPAIDLVVIASTDTTLLAKVNQLVTRGVGALFVKPVAPEALLTKLRFLRPRPARASNPPRAHSSRPPSTRMVASKPISSPPSRFATLPPVGTRGSAPPSPVSVAPSRAPSGLPGVPEAVLLQAGLSQELADLLSAAEARVADVEAEDALMPSPADEIEAVLPREVLAALDAPLDEDEDDDFVGVDAPSMTTGARRSTTTGVGDDAELFTRDDIREGDVDTRSGKSDDTGTNARRTNTREAVATEAPSASLHEAAVAAPARSLVPLEHLPDAGLRILAKPSEPVLSDEGPPSSVPRAQARDHESPSLAPAWEERAQTLQPGPERAPASRSHSGVLTQPGDAFRPLSRAITGRRTVTLTIRETAREGSIQRRVVLMGGDLVTCASDAPSETLLEFLVERGDILRTTAERTAAKIPAGGRYAAAALVARGVLHNDDMWEVLRAHALWLCGKAMHVQRGSYVLETSGEADPDLARLLSEPAVFGAKSGAEVFLEVVRRVVSREVAERALGGLSAQMFLGEHGPLLSESGLAEGDVAAIRAREGHRLSDVMNAITESDALPIIYGLSLLEIFRIVLPPESPSRPPSSVAPASVPGVARTPALADPIDDEARRARIAARAALVQEGDYFALLGVSRRASSYEIRAAYLALRREFEPSRILTPQIAELADTVLHITIVLEEAYEVLRDEPRRERYLRAIEGIAPKH